MVQINTRVFYLLLEVGLLAGAIAATAISYGTASKTPMSATLGAGTPSSMMTGPCVPGTPQIHTRYDEKETMWFWNMWDGCWWVNDAWFPGTGSANTPNVTPTGKKQFP